MTIITYSSEHQIAIRVIYSKLRHEPCKVGTLFKPVRARGKVLCDHTLSILSCYRLVMH